MLGAASIALSIGSNTDRAANRATGGRLGKSRAAILASLHRARRGTNSKIERAGIPRSVNPGSVTMHDTHGAGKFSNRKGRSHD